MNAHSKVVDEVRRGGFDARALDRLVAASTAGPVLVEQFRGLAATLHRLKRERTLKSLLITSAAPGDGKSHVAVNLALTLSLSYRRRVLLIDADLRRPTLHLLFQKPGTPGLLDVLRAEGDEIAVGISISETLTLLPAGGPESNPIGDLSSSRMVRLMANAVSQFDWVIVDSPPVGGLADARLISETVDAALLVIRAGVTRHPDVMDAASAIPPEKLLGVVLNAIDPADIRRDDYYSHYYNGS